MGMARCVSLDPTLGVCDLVRKFGSTPCATTDFCMHLRNHMKLIWFPAQWETVASLQIQYGTADNKSRVLHMDGHRSAEISSLNKMENDKLICQLQAISDDDLRKYVDSIP